mgnify:CR=1 FL=1
MKIFQNTIRDQLVEQIKNQILNGELKPGDKIPTEIELSEQYSVGRGSIREALQHLLAIGLLERKKKFIYVAEDVSEIISEPLNLLIGLQKISPFHFFETRLVIEIALAGLAALRREQEDLERMSECVAKMEASRNHVEAFIENNICFHNAVAHASKNPLLIKLFEAIKDTLIEQQRLVIDRGIARYEAIEEHKEILQAITDKNQRLAENKMRIHLKKGMEKFISKPGSKKPS